MIIDLSKVKTYLISPASGKYRERLLTVFSRLINEGFCEIIFYKSLPGTSGTNSLTNTVIEILNKELKNDKPFMILEDDCNFFTKYDKIEIPDNCDALYLGVSKWVYPHAVDTLYLRQRPNIRENSSIDHTSYNDTLTKINGMTATHAILFNSREYIRQFIDKMTDILKYVDDMPHDLLFASLQKSFNVFALKSPLFYQDSTLGGQEDVTRLKFDGTSYTFSN
jgi:hypothetical protein